MVGVYASAPEYLSILRSTIHLYVGVFLLYRFHPFRTNTDTFSELDRKVVFTAGAFIAMTTILGTSLNRYINKAKRRTWK